VFESAPVAFQARLTISQPGDRYEREADRVADAVMRMAEPLARPDIAREQDAAREERPGVATQSVARHITPLIQRELGVEEGEVIDELMQREPHPGQAVTDVSGVETGIHALQNSGQPLDAATRSFFEPRFGHDFGQVRVHTGSKAHDLARSVQARAFTLGHDIVFAQREYMPASNAGKRLLAHELTHVVQQRQSAVSRTIFRTPSVNTWDFMNTGSTSNDNCCAVCPIDLGVDSMSAQGYHNGMELRVYMLNHEAGASYDIKRTKHRKVSQRIGGTWSTVAEVGPGADDDSSNRDECLTPTFSMVGDYIYSTDAPGFRTRANPVNVAPAATDVAYIANFTESVRITHGGTTTDDPTTFDWHSVSWATKVNGSWEFNTANSEIEPGHRASVDP
jgi:hypothetical protein